MTAPLVSEPSSHIGKRGLKPQNLKQGRNFHGQLAPALGAMQPKPINMAVIQAGRSAGIAGRRHGAERSEQK